MSFNQVLSNLLQGRIKYHGNYCGPGWSAGKYQNSVIDKSVKPVDKLDALCMKHDAAYAKAQQFEDRGKSKYANVLRNRADKEFSDGSHNLGIKASLASGLISAQRIGRSLFNLPSDKDMRPSKRLRNADPIKEEVLGGITDTEMEDEPVPEPEGQNLLPAGESRAMLAAPAGSGRIGYKETPISIPPTLTYGLQDTHTTIIPLTTYFSATKLDISSPLVYDIFTTNPYNPILDTPSSPTFTTGTWTINTKGMWNKSIIASSTGTSTNNLDFPNTNDVPAWWNYWTTIYDYYTVLSCEYDITFVNTTTSSGADALIGSMLQSGGNRVYESIPLKDAQCLKNMQWHECYQNTVSNPTEPHRCHIRGTYKPGQARRNVVNDDDVKTWTATSSSPSLDERLSLFMFAHPLHYTNPSTVNTNLICQVRLKYIVQFKDLNERAKYPTSVIGSSIIQTLPSDALMG